MTVKKNILTSEGLKKLEDELEELIVVKRKEVAQKIKEAREQGDLSENAEYDAAKDEQRDIEARIEELEKILKNAEVVDEDEVDTDKIGIGCKVTVLDVAIIDGTINGTYTIAKKDDGNYYVTVSYTLLYTSVIDEFMFAVDGNVLTLTKYLGNDPEFSVSNNVLYQGVDAGLLPQTRSFHLGVKVNL